MAINTIYLSWDVTSTDELGFKVYQSEDGIIFTLVQTLEKGTESTIVPIIDEKYYWFRITAFNGAGESRYTQIGPLICRRTFIKHIAKMRRISHNRKTL